MFVSITKDSYIAAERVHSIVPQEFIQFRRIKKAFLDDDVVSQEERKNDLDMSVKGSSNLIDITYGKSVETIIFMDSGHIILSSLEARKIIDKVKKARRTK